ncbi:hypothetical protein A6V36_34185 [Paraburkholderia ginsengiterrae]|uniref:Small-conductance mechanosensitive channel n=1 Tax=Paraburkholderia ginsengiterrae TaxID=1462993 RepID=A0A1A9NBC6_9BURK|nr:hypothetical protein A6V36_34185 [Paraburkholderia ginsengiterrae]OAJ63679.1 hypothetical protein A6V37_20340 [Paraburkholderia ginsengiterrae]
MVVVPNGKIIGGNIINYTRHPHRRIEIIVGVAYDSEVSHVKAVLSRVVESDSRILHHLGNTIRLNEMAASSLNYVVRVWANNADYWDVYYDMMEGIKTALDKHKIGIPYPQLDVHFHRAAVRAECTAD